ncbi:hypothetical protein ABIA99_005999 [Bradyrhizobium sp. LB12.1]|uniref:hypothetical protein n=1 Tax=Bradyrhizobium sp. LB12.1 TaxID=3156327 RepID=UPI0033945109
MKRIFVPLLSTTAILIPFIGSPASACGGIFDAACNLSHGGLSPSNVVKQTVKAADDVGKTGEKALHDAGTTGEKALHDAGNTGEKALHDVGNTGEKALHDTGKATEQAVHDVGTAGETIGRFVERELKGLGQTVSDADKRIREGKIVDAIWHAGTDPLKHSEENAAKATQESNILRTVGQVAAAAYGGPGGAAAYAAWYTYRATGGDVDMAIRVGLITGAASAGFNAAGKLPTDTTAQIAQKAIVTGAIGGLAVAAAGGDKDAVRDGFLLSGGMVLIQTGYEKATDHQLDGRASKGEAYCMATIGAECSPPKSAYVTDKAGNTQFDKDGNPLVDVTKTDALRPHVGTWAKENETPIIGVGERSASMTAVSRIPGMNAMALFHDNWAVSWDMNAFTSVTSIVPAVVLTYTGTGAPYFDRLEATATKDEPGSKAAN